MNTTEFGCFLLALGGDFHPDGKDEKTGCDIRCDPGYFFSSVCRGFHRLSQVLSYGEYKELELWLAEQEGRVVKFPPYGPRPFILSEETIVRMSPTSEKGYLTFRRASLVEGLQKVLSIS